MAIVGVLLLKGSAGAGPCVERSEPKRGFPAEVSVRLMVTVTVAVSLPLGLGLGWPLLVHIWGLPERTGQSASGPAGWIFCRASTYAEPVCPPKTMSGLLR